MRVLRRDDTEHGVDYVTLHEAQTAIEDATHELRQALSGRTVSCSNCNAMAAENEAMREAINAAHDALSWCYDVVEWPANGLSKQDRAITKLQPFLK